VSLLFLPCSVVSTHRPRCVRGLFWFRLRTVGSPGQRCGGTTCGDGASSLRTGATSSTASFRGTCLTTVATSSDPLRKCIALAQARDADGPWRRRWRCKARSRTLGRRQAGRQRRSGDTLGRVLALGLCEKPWQLPLRGVRQLQELALGQLCQR